MCEKIKMCVSWFERHYCEFGKVGLMGLLDKFAHSWFEL